MLDYLRLSPMIGGGSLSLKANERTITRERERGRVMNTYSEDNTCINCKKTGEVIYHQYSNAYSCQYCGKWWANE